MSKEISQNALVSRAFPALPTTSLPRSGSFVKDLLFVLKEGQLRTCEVAKIAEKTSAYVDSYLRRMRNQGLVEKQGFFWNLSESGVSFLGYLEKVEDRRYRYRHYLDKTTTQHQHSLDTQKQKKLKQVRIDPWLHSCNLPDKEKEIVEVLVDHYNQTDSKCLYFRDQYAIAERFQVTPEEIKAIFRNLKQDHICYCWPDPNLGLKVALYKSFLEMLAIGSS